MEEFIANGAILGGAVQDCRPTFAPVCLIMDRSSLSNFGQKLQRNDYLFALVLAPVLRFQTANPHSRCSEPIISSWSKDERKAATR